MIETIQKGVPGLSVAIADRDGIVWSGAAGMADVTREVPVSEDHLFGIGSITKTFVAVVTLQLVEEGRISLDTTVVDILGKEIAGRVPGADRATIAQLLNHTSGIPSWEDDPLWIKEGRGEKLDVTRIWGREDTLKYTWETPLTNEPGEKYAYSNTNHTLLGLVIEKITGNDIVHEIQARILLPIGLSDVYLEGFQRLPKSRLATRYHYTTQEFRRDAGVHDSFEQITDDLADVSTSNLSVEWTAGGMVATAQDLVRYAAAFRSGKLLSPASMAIVKDWFPISEAAEVGHGLFRRQLDSGQVLIGHTGSVLGYTGAMYWFEDRDVSVVVLANVGTMHIGQKLPNAASLANSPTFVKQVLSLYRSAKAEP
jgi:D-alanyl-D-alanine carboxypeptidase